MPETTTRSAFLHLMDAAIPWDMLAQVARAGVEDEAAAWDVRQGLRIYFLQHWFGWSDEALVDAMHDSRSVRYFLQQKNGTSATTSVAALQDFRQWLERRDMGSSLLNAMARHLEARGIELLPGSSCSPCVRITAPAAPSWHGELRGREGASVCR